MGEEGDFRDCSNAQAPIKRAVEIALWKGMAEYLYSSLFCGVRAAQIICLDSSCFCGVLILNKNLFYPLLPALISVLSPCGYPTVSYKLDLPC